MRLWARSLPLPSGSRIRVAVSRGVGRRCSLDPTLLWLWCGPVAIAPIRPLAWEPPYALGAALEKAKRQKQNETKSLELVTGKGGDGGPEPVSFTLFPTAASALGSTGPIRACAAPQGNAVLLRIIIRGRVPRPSLYWSSIRSKGHVCFPPAATGTLAMGPGEVPTLPPSQAGSVWKSESRSWRRWLWPPGYALLCPAAAGSRLAGRSSCWPREPHLPQRLLQGLGLVGISARSFCRTRNCSHPFPSQALLGLVSRKPPSPSSFFFWSFCHFGGRSLGIWRFPGWGSNPP